MAKLASIFDPLVFVAPLVRNGTTYRYQSNVFGAAMMELCSPQIWWFSPPNWLDSGSETGAVQLGLWAIISTSSPEHYLCIYGY